MRLEGSCQCEKVRFRVDSDTPVPFMYCFCSICRKTTGGPFGCNVMGKRPTLTVTGRQHLRRYNARIRNPGKKTVISSGERWFCGAPLRARRRMARRRLAERGRDRHAAAGRAGARVHDDALQAGVGAAGRPRPRAALPRVPGAVHRRLARKDGAHGCGEEEDDEDEGDEEDDVGEGEGSPARSREAGRAARRSRTAAASSCSTGTVSSQPRQASVMLWP
jgi:hypothetical protein